MIMLYGEGRRAPREALSTRLATTVGFLGRLLRAVRMLVTYQNPLTAIKNRLARRPTEDRLVRYALRSGPTLSVDPGPHDVRVINEIWLDRIYELDRRLVPHPGWTVFDVGAHKGIYSARVAWLMRSGRLYAFEPEPRNFGVLITNVPALPGLDFHPNNVAIGAVSGKRLLQLQPRASGQHSLYPSRSEARDADSKESTLLVDVRSIEEVVDEAGAAVDLLKLDAEGAEYEIILDSSQSCLLAVQRIVMEYDPTDPRDRRRDVGAVHDRLEDLGFEVHRLSRRPIMWAVQTGQ